jgi:hypothetical protein
VPGPWKPFPRQPEGYLALALPAPAAVQVYSPSYPIGSPVLGPWNRFRSGLSSGGTGSPSVPVSPPPPPPPPGVSVPFGPGRQSVPQVPRAPEETDRRLRPFVDKVSAIVNSLLRQGYLVQGPDGSWILSGGSIVLPRSPLPGDDSTVGAVVGGTFVNSLDQSVWVCVSNAPGAAVWKRVG